MESAATASEAVARWDAERGGAAPSMGLPPFTYHDKDGRPPAVEEKRKPALEEERKGAPAGPGAVPTGFGGRTQRCSSTAWICARVASRQAQPKAHNGSRQAKAGPHMTASFGG